VKKRMGEHYWLDTYRSRLALVLQKPDAKGPASIEELYTTNRSYGINKAKAFSYLLDQMIPATEINRVWSNKEELATNESFIKSIEDYLDLLEVDKTVFELMIDGYLNSSPYNEGFSILEFQDTDRDGLPDYYELYTSKTNPKISDSDVDGWTDYAEVFAGTNPNTASERPTSIIPDGDFSDWLELMPKRITVDKGQTSVCPKAADISHYSAIASRDHLIIGAFVSDFWDLDKNARWEALFDFPEVSKSILLTATSNSNSYLLRDAQTMELLKIYTKAPLQGKTSVEWAIDRNAIGIESYLNKESAVRVRLRTIYTKDGKDIYCDETKWFTPYISG